MKRVILLCLMLLPALASAADGQTHVTQLPNGLKLIVREDHRTPAVVTMVWYKIGSAYEPGGITGVSHLLEHMMFKGTQKYPADTFSKIIAKNGGKQNAFTNTDYTAYFQTMAADRLETSFKLEADRMQNLTFSEKDFKKEIEVVKEERRMRVDDRPEALTYERFMAAAHLTNPYHHMVIGWMSDLNSLTLQDAKRWYEQWYAPNNATVVVVGDVDPNAVVKLAKRHFGPLQKKTLPRLKPQHTPDAISTRQVNVSVPARLPQLYIGFNVPSLKTAKDQNEAYALEVLAGILDIGRSARIPKNIIRKKQLASSASAGYDLYQLFDGLFILDAVPSRGNTVDAVKTALLKEVERLKKTPVTPAELKRIKAQVVADKVYDKDSLFGQAMAIGALESMGIPWEAADAYADKIRAITPEQIQAVAKKYLTKDRMTVAILTPKK